MLWTWTILMPVYREWKFPCSSLNCEGVEKLWEKERGIISYYACSCNTIMSVYFCYITSWSVLLLVPVTWQEYFLAGLCLLSHCHDPPCHLTLLICRSQRMSLSTTMLEWVHQSTRMLTLIWWCEMPGRFSSFILFIHSSLFTVIKFHGCSVRTNLSFCLGVCHLLNSSWVRIMSTFLHYFACSYLILFTP